MIIRRVVALVLVAAAVGFALYRCSYVPLRCSRDVWRSEKELLAAAERADSYYRVVAGRDSLNRLLEDCDARPLDVNRPVLIALSHRFLEQHSESVAWYQRALSIDRRPEIYLGLGIEQVRSGQRREGIENLALVSAFAPTMLDAIDDPILRNEVRSRAIAKYGPEWMR